MKHLIRYSIPTHNTRVLLSVLCFTALFTINIATQVNAAKSTADPQAAYLEVLTLLGETLYDLQEKDPTHEEFGGIRDPENGIYYTRAAEALYPFTVLYKLTDDKKWLDAAIHTGNWLISKQEETGEWVENPWEWTGTTADQLLMMAASWPTLIQYMSDDEKKAWKQSIQEAADYLVEKMSPDWASFNYVPTTAGCLAVVYENVTKDPAHLEKARILARQSVAKLDRNYFFEGEAARVHGVKYGVDLGYQIDMSLWGLTLYARTVGDKETEDIIRKSMENVLWFVYPDGAIDASWGARAYKWTSYGSKTADGCQVTFAMWADENPAYQTASLRNLEYLKHSIQEGLVGYGPHIWAMPGKLPNIYPTFARAKNIAMAIEYGRHQTGKTPPLPSESGDFVKHFPSVNVALVGTKNFMATISSYDYIDYTNWGDGKYTHFPRGGAMVNLWLKDHGFLTTSSQTRYSRGEPIHMPPIEEPIQPLTPRIEFENENGYFTNLYDSYADLEVLDSEGDIKKILVSGKLCDQNYHPGGVAYRILYEMSDMEVKKTVFLRYHDRFPQVRILEPIVKHDGVSVSQSKKDALMIKGNNRELKLSLDSGEATIQLGENADEFWYPFPGMRAIPVVMEVDTPKDSHFRTISYSYQLKE
ncbi:MAG: hypothetical protein MI748_21270 [Opitutales bacterium]|nr:hypothetical protein [Opitutales bacterium]